MQGKMMCLICLGFSQLGNRASRLERLLVRGKILKLNSEEGCHWEQHHRLTLTFRKLKGPMAENSMIKCPFNQFGLRSISF